ncbi:MFS transporter [Oricola nitratireducens]|uniref:MFS transporter n=1 Tax=Oricola nitratireducens TaxID=2775868 RepID=UPI001FEF9C75|nr:MFS transporter [Oricola nitratireducens]
MLHRPQAVPASDGLDAPQRYWAWLAILLTVTLAVLDGTIATVALPSIAADFGASPSASIWIVNGYQLAVVVSLLPIASLGEILGYRRVYLAGVALFTAASLACMLSTSLPALSAARVMQGFGGAGVMSVNTALIRYVVPKAKFGTALGINALIVACAATAGPAIAGFMLTWFAWPWLFAINVPLGVLAIAIGFFNLPMSDRAQRRFDWVSALLSAMTIGLMVATIDTLGHGARAAWVAAGIAGMAAAATLLVRRAMRVAEPLLPLDLLRLPVFAMSIGTSISSFTAQMLAFVSLPFAFQTIMGFSPAEVGMLMMPWPLATGFSAPLAGRLADRYSPAILGGIGLAAMAAGLAALMALPEHPSIPDVAWRMLLCGAGFGFFQTPNNRTLITSAPKERSGSASGMLSTARLTGQTTGAALASLLLARFGITGAVTALGVASGFAALAAAVSLARIGFFRTHEAK